MSYQPPTDILEVLSKIEYENALEAGDPRYVDTREARGSQKTLDRLARKFGLLLADGRFVPPAQKHVLFFGHTGSGKTTELRHYAEELSGPGRFFVAEVDITVTLDRNNLQYADTLMAMAQSLLQRLFDKGVTLPANALEDLKKWFDERVLSADDSKEFSAEIRSGAEAELGLPFLIKLFSGFTTAFRANATYKESFRRIIRNHFTQLAEAFNVLLRLAERKLAEHGLGNRVLFIIDGTDKLRGEDTRRFFVEDAEQLLAVAGHVVYTAPLGLKYESGLVGRLDGDLVLPMIKLFEKDGPKPDSIPHEAGQKAIREILLLRADRSLFASDEEIQTLVAHSGGHPRELLRLLKLCCEYAEENRIDQATVQQAVQQLASEYRRFLEPEDYATLAGIDADPVHTGNDERGRKLLYSLVLLEYNDGAWRRSHPVVRTLEGYLRAAAARSNTVSS